MKTNETPKSDRVRPAKGAAASTLPDLAFFNAGCAEKSGLRKLIVPPRRVLRRILRPIFQHQVALFQYIVEKLDSAEKRDLKVQSEMKNLKLRQEKLGDQIQATQALGWDHVALVRRIAVLEDRVEALLKEREEERDGSARFSHAKAS